MAEPSCLRLITSQRTLYTFRGPLWNLGWAINLNGQIERYCYLYDADGNTLDPSISEHVPMINEILKTLIPIVANQIEIWSLNGDLACEKLLETANLPSYLIYAKCELGLSL
jgi:hypothetical protein